MKDLELRKIEALERIAKSLETLEAGIIKLGENEIRKQERIGKAMLKIY